MMSLPRCSVCGAENRAGARFCIRCGGALPTESVVEAAPAEAATTAVSLADSCSKCGVPLRPGSRFCPACGHPIDGPSHASNRTPTERRLAVRWPGGQTEHHALKAPKIAVGRATDNDIVLSFATVSAHHLRLDVLGDEVQVTDLHSTNGTLLRGRKIQPGIPQVWRGGETLRVGDLRGNSISMVLESGGAPSLHTYPLGMYRLGQASQVLIGRDPACQISLDHPTVSRRHAEIERLGSEHQIRDLGSVNGTFVNGERVTDHKRLQMGDVVQIGPYKLVYDGHAGRLSTSVSQGHRLDAIGLGTQVSGGRMILEDISVSVQGGEFAALVGGSGAGKSTLLKAMNGFHPATHGRMLIDGEPLYPNLAAYRTLMGYVPQDDIIHKTLPVRKALWYAAKLRLPDATLAEIERRINAVLEMVELTAHQDKPVRVLSGGQRKRVSIAVELLAEPDLLFLDEPTSGLDPGLEKKMMYDLNRLADQGRTIVLVTHATANIEQCDHVAFLVQGNLAYYGPPQEAMTFFQARDFADIYLKLSEVVDAGKEEADASNVPPDLQPYVQRVRERQAIAGAPADGFPAGLLWAEHYCRSTTQDRYVADRQLDLAAVRSVDQPAAVDQPPRGRDSLFRQLFILGRRQFDLVRNDVRTLFVLLVMMPLIGLLFMLVSQNTAFVGRPVTEATLRADLLAGLNVVDEAGFQAEHVGEKAEYLPLQDAANLVTMLGLALTQAGTFGAAYEIVKERAIFQREKSVNLQSGAYVLSKALVLGCFAVIQVASVLMVLGLKLDLSFAPILRLFPSGVLELFVTLLVAVVASIMFGLFISAIVPSQDVVLYVILVQLFAQIILSGTLFPLENNPASKLVVSYWTMDAMGATVDLNRLNADSLICKVVEQEVPTAQGTIERLRGIGCDSAARDSLDLSYTHTANHLLTAWGALAAQAIFWCVATVIVQSRVRGD